MGASLTDAECHANIWRGIVETISRYDHPDDDYFWFRGEKLANRNAKILLQYEYGTTEWEFTWELMLTV